MIPRRTLLRHLAGAASAPFLPGLVPLRSAAAAGGPPLRLWTTETEPQRLRVVEYIAAAYGAWADRPAPVILSLPESDLMGAMAGARRSATLPDLVNTGGDLLLALSEAGVLDEDAAGAFVSEYDDLFPGAVAALRVAPGHQAAIPFHGWPQVLWYRQDWLEEAGLTAPTTADTLLAAVQALHREETGRMGIVCGTDSGLYTQQVFAQIVRSFGGALFSADGRPRLADSVVREALAYYAVLASHGPAGAHHWRARDWYLQGRAAAMFYSTFIMDDLAIAGVAADSLKGGRFAGLDGAAFDIDLVSRTGFTTRLGPPAAAFSTINGLAIVRHRDPNGRAAALDFLRFLFRPDSMVVWLHMAPGGMLPVRSGLAGSEAFLRDPLGVFRRFGRDAVRTLSDGLATAGGFSHWNGTNVTRAATIHADGVIGRMVAAVIAGEATPTEASRAAQQEAEILAGGP